MYYGGQHRLLANLTSAMLDGHSTARAQASVSGIRHISAIFDVETDSRPEDRSYLYETARHQDVRMDSITRLHRWSTITGAFPLTADSFTIYQQPSLD